MRVTAKWAVFLLISLVFLCKISAISVSPPLKIAAGVVSEVASTLSNWLWSPNTPAPKIQIGHSKIKFEGGYAVQTVFDGKKLGIEPYSVEVSPTGELIILDSVNSNIHKISSPLSEYSRRKLLTGSVEGYTGHVDGKVREARMHQPKGIAVDDRGNIYIADTMNMAVRKISDSGVVTTIAGGRISRGSHVDDLSEDAKFSDDFDVTYVRSSCSLLVVDRGSQVIREIQLQYDDCNASVQPQSQDTEGNFNLVSEETIEEDPEPELLTKILLQCSNSERSIKNTNRLLTETCIPSRSSFPAEAAQKITHITGKSLIEQKLAAVRAAKHKVVAPADNLAHLHVPDATASASKLNHLELIDDIGVNAWMAFQDALSLKARMKDISDEADKRAAYFESKVEELKSYISGAESRAQEAEQRLKEAQKSVSDMKAVHERMASQEKHIKMEYARIARDVGAYFSLKARIEMMEEFQSGHHESWNMWNEVADLQMLYPDGQPGVDLLGLVGLHVEDVDGDKDIYPEIVPVNVHVDLVGDIQKS